MPEFCSDPLVCTQNAAATKRTQFTDQQSNFNGYLFNDITVLIIGNPNRFVIDTSIVSPIFCVVSFVHSACRHPYGQGDCIHSSIGPPTQYIAPRFIRSLGSRLILLRASLCIGCGPLRDKYVCHVLAHCSKQIVKVELLYNKTRCCPS